MKSIAIVGEDEGHFQVVTTLVDDIIVTYVDWLRDILDSARTWRGLRETQQADQLLEDMPQPDRPRPWYKYDPADANDLRPFKMNGRTLRPQGWIGGERLKPEAGMWRKVLMMFCQAEPRPDLVVLVRDLDGYPDRRAGMEQVRTHLEWPFPIVIATPQPEMKPGSSLGSSRKMPSARGSTRSAATCPSIPRSIRIG